ncbi:putative ribosomal N-acetyltransferase YdaF [Calidithermus roseus]|uniref:Putative ribosomal N-acetyltransferase YdaF n=1 Tax=Calidithermus roseus TaxID=1644118 RepID=A0A399EB51_9DEIN|nr:putative ribosomal N-acetyltransferase YdaF [Calidithermus roseus]
MEVGGKAVGWIALLVDWQNQIAEIATWLGRPYWSSGVNREAKSLVLDYGFGSLNLQRIESITHVENIKAQRGLEKLGFVREGVLRRYRKVKGWHWDMVMYSLLPEEWWQRQGS